jgi:large subunit ribosomal protein L9
LEVYALRLLLLQDVKSLGKKGTIVEASDGYARNFLMPKKLAAPATEGIIRSQQKEQIDLLARKEREAEQARATARIFEATELEMAVRVGEGGKLFGAITATDVAEAIKKQLDQVVDKRKIQLGDPIKNLGEHHAVLKLHPEVNAKLRLRVRALDGHKA